MPYELYAAVEVGGPPWRMVGEILTPFWSADSRELFGLGKRGGGPPLFGSRGVPIDCSDGVKARYRQEAAFIARHPGAAGSLHGDTNATWAELKDAIGDDPDVLGGPLSAVLARARSLEGLGHAPEQIRVLLWGRW